MSVAPSSGPSTRTDNWPSSLVCSSVKSHPDAGRLQLCELTEAVSLAPLTGPPSHLYGAAWLTVPEWLGAASAAVAATAATGRATVARRSRRMSADPEV